jgi:hypothetical protein
MNDFSEYRSALNAIDRYVYALCEIKGEERIPFYIGRGMKDRCLHHLREENDSEKVLTIQRLRETDSLGIDILRHGIKNEKTVKIVEATCIDLLGIGVLANKVRGYGKDMGRVAIEEIDALVSGKEIPISPEHSGLAFLLNDTYKSGMSRLQLFESTRGIWRNVPRSDEIRFAYATYGGLVKEVYQINCWVEAGTQQYFTRTFSEERRQGRWEFVGKIADEEIRSLYVGKKIEKPRSYGFGFVKVGC